MKLNIYLLINTAANNHTALSAHISLCTAHTSEALSTCVKHKFTSGL